MSKNYQTDENGVKLTEDGEVIARAPEQPEELKKKQAFRTEVATCIGFRKLDKVSEKGKMCMANFVLGKHNYFEGLFGNDLKFLSKWFEHDLTGKISLGCYVEVDYSTGLNGQLFLKGIRPYVKQEDFT